MGLLLSMRGFLGRARASLENHWAGLSEGQRAARKFGFVAIGMALLAAPAWWWGRPVWQRWQQRAALEQVRTFSAGGDYRSAALALRRAIALGPADAATWREAVRLLGTIGTPEVLTAHEQLARLQPDDPAVKLAWIRDALRFEQTGDARRTMETLDEAARRDAAFFRLAAALAMALGRTDEVEANFERLVEVVPDDAGARFNLAAVRLWSEDEAKRRGAREALEEMAGREAVGLRAALELLKAAAREHDERRMRETLAILQARYVPGWRADFPDAGAAGVARLIEQLKMAAATEGAESVALLARWLADVGQPRETLVWLDTLPDELAKAAEVMDVGAAVSVEIGDLDRLEGYLRAGAWGAWPRDVLTLAMASRLQRLRYGEAQGRATWENALTAAGDSLPALRALVRLADGWNDGEATERALQVVVERFPKSGWAYDALRSLYASRGDTQRLWQVYGQWVRHQPEALDVVASWIVLGAVLDRVDEGMAARAEEIFARGQRESAAVMALAAVRWRQRKPGETLNLLQTLPRETREAAAGSFWETLAAADLGDREAVQAALQRATRTGMSPEEAKLLREAAIKVKLAWQLE